MDYHELWQRIRYRKGHMLIPSCNASSELAILVVRQEGDRLILRCDTAPNLAEGSSVLLEIWGPDVLTRVAGTLDQTVPRAYGGAMLVVHIRDVDTVERRTSSRYEIRLPATFIPLTGCDDETGQERLDRHAVGHATNIGVGGMQLETKHSMPVETKLSINVSAPGGPILVEGRVVSRRTDAVGMKIYGIEFVKFDNLTIARLHRMVNRMERDQRRGGHQTRSTAGFSGARRRRLRRAPLTRRAYR